MVLADIGLFQLIWTMFFLFMLAAIIWVFILVVRDMFRNPELPGWAKAVWLVGLILFPLLGSLIYIIVRGLWLGSGEDALARASMSRTEQERYDRKLAAAKEAGPAGPP